MTGDAAPASGSTPERDRSGSGWRGRLHLYAWAVLTLLWLVLAAWLLRLGEAVTVVWALSAGLHLVLLTAWPVLAVGVLLRRRPLAIAAAVTVLAQLAVAWPLLPWPHRLDDIGRPLHIASLNAYVDNQDLDRAARQLVDEAPDVLVVQEFTFHAQAAFRRAGFSTVFPHRIEHPNAGTAGQAIYSRYPLREVRVSRLQDVVAATVTRPGGRRLRVFSVHAFAPQTGDPGVWQREIHALDRALSATPGQWVALGDFNATLDHRTYRDLLHDGHRDAHVVTGRGLARTWPEGKGVPPLALIDHAVLGPGVEVARTWERTIAGSDHRMIGAALVL